MIKISQLLVLGLIIVSSWWWTWTNLQADVQSQSKPNLLVISVCSLRHQILKTYGANEVTMPAVEDFFRSSSVRFANAINGMPWTSIFESMRLVLTPAAIQNLGYALHSNNHNSYSVRIPRRQSTKPGFDDADDNSFEKNISEDLSHLASLVRHAKRSPFVVVAHIKYLHYPLIDRFNSDSEWDFFLSDDEKTTIKKYLGNPQKYPEKFPLLVMLANETAGATRHPLLKQRGLVGIQDFERRVRGLITDPEILAVWQGSVDYPGDLAILNKVYRANARYLDKKVGEIIDLWGDADLKKNTVVVFSGDHGELHMERGILGHANDLSDESLRVPLAIHFPGRENSGTVINEQVGFMKIANLLDGYLRKAVKPSHLEKVISRRRNDPLLLRNCLNTVRGVRWRNKYKYLYDVAAGEPILYDLKQDPKELTNVASSLPSIVDDLEKLYWANLEDFLKVSPGGCRTFLDHHD